MALIPLTKGKFAIVDEEDSEELNKYRWQAKWKRKYDTYYAVRKTPERKGKSICMHRVILGLSPGDGKLSDHSNRNTLDNRRSNLRIATPVQNMWNRSIARTNTSGFKGVHWHIRANKWISSCRVKGKIKQIGKFDSKEDAAQAYILEAYLHFGEFATLGVRWWASKSKSS